jgi:opacity protein-like surface antigen
MKHLSVLFVAVLVLIAAGSAAAQGEKRIQFAKGKSSTTVVGSTGANGTTYVVRARSGQKLVLTLTPRTGIGIKVEKEGRFGHEVLLREERGGTYEVGLEESGDVTIFLGSTSGRSAAFTLTVKIVKMTDI